MKKILTILTAIALFGFAVSGAYALSVFVPQQGGTGVSTIPSSGQLLIGNSSNTYTPAYLTAGTGITISTSSGAITINSTGSDSFTTSTFAGLTDTSWLFTSANNLISVSTSTSPSTITITATSTPTFTTVNGVTPSSWLTGVTADSPLSGSGTSASHLIWTNPGFITATSTAFIATSTGDWFGTWQTHSPSYFQTALGFTPANSSVTISAGDGLSGGGDLSTNRTLTLNMAGGVCGGGDFVSSLSATGTIICTTPSGSGITSLNGSTSSTQTFATSSDTNIGLTIGTLNGVHTFTPTWIGTLADGRIASAATWNAKQNAISFPIPVASTSLTASLPLLITANDLSLTGRLATINNIATSTGSLILGQGNTTGWAGLAIGTNGKVLTASSTATGGVSWEAAGVGTVTSVDMSVPTGLTIGGNPITTAGTLALSWTAGYEGLKTASSTDWNTAYTDRLKWDGGSTGLTPATGRTSLELGSMALLANTGSSSITTLGTIGTGIWNGTAIGDTWISSASNWNSKATSTLTLTAGSGLTGGGDLSANRTFTVGAGTNIVVNADDVAVTSTPNFTTLTLTNPLAVAQGGTGLTSGYNNSNWNTAYTDRLKWDGGSTGLVAATGRTSLGLGSLATANSVGYASTTGFSYATSGASGLQIASSSGVWTFSQATSTGSVGGFLSASDWTTFNNKVGTSLTLTAGAGLTGGGDLSANRTFTVGAGTGITVNADDVALTIPVAVSSGGTGVTSYTAGSITFAGAGGTTLTQDNANIFWDDTNNNLGIGTTTPATSLVVVGSSTISGTGSALVFPDNTRQTTASKGIGFNVLNATTTATATTTIQKLFYEAITITQIDCSTNGANITIGADERASSTPNTVGTAIGGNMVCDSNGFSTSSFSNATIAAGTLLNFNIVSAANATTTLRTYIKYKEQ